MSEGENRARITSSIITGIFITGDDFSDSGSTILKESKKSLLLNKEILDLAKRETPFKPVESNTVNGAGNMFVLHEQGVTYLVVFNFNENEADEHLLLSRIDLFGNKSYHVKELISGNEWEIMDSL